MMNTEPPAVVTNSYQPTNFDSRLNSRKRKKVLIITCSIAVVLALLIGGGIWWFLETTRDDGLIYSNVYAADINLSGMTREEAAAAIAAAAEKTYSGTDLLITFPDTQLILTPGDTGVKLDAEKLAEDAFAYGRDGNRWENFQAKSAAALTRYDLDTGDYLTLNTDFIRDALDSLAAEVGSTLSQPAVTVNGQTPALDRTMKEAEADTSVEHMSITIVTGIRERTVDTDGLYDAILNAYHTGNLSPITVEYHETEPESVDLLALYNQYYIAPVDAVIDETTYVVTPETLGYGFDLDAAQALVDAAAPGSEIVIAFDYIPAEITGESLTFEPFTDKLSSYSSPHTNDSNRTRNLELACKAIDGTVIAPGEVFSFNKIVGKRTEEKGYKAAGAFSGGKNVTTIGGGICQVASTIYYCTLMADMEIVERTEHGFKVTYVPPGMDATIAWDALDFKFRNSSNYPIRIDAKTSGGYCHISIYGTNDKDYYVEMTYELTDGPNYKKEEVVEFTKDNNPNHYKDGQVIQTAYTGYSYKTYRNKYDAETKKLISSEYEDSSTYKSRAKIVAKLVQSKSETETTQPPTTQPPVTEPPTTQPPVTEPPATQPPETEPPETTETTPPATEPTGTTVPKTEAPTESSGEASEPAA